MTKCCLLLACVCLTLFISPVSAATKHRSKAAPKADTYQQSSDQYYQPQNSGGYYSNYYPQQQYYQNANASPYQNSYYNWSGYQSRDNNNYDYYQQQPSQPYYSASNQASANSNQRGSAISAIYTLRTCPHCIELESSLQQSGVKLNITGTNQRYYGAFPTVVYTDGTTDHGDRIYGGSVRLPNSVRIVETN